MWRGGILRWRGRKRRRARRRRVRGLGLGLWGHLWEDIVSYWEGGSLLRRIKGGARTVFSGVADGRGFGRCGCHVDGSGIGTGLRQVWRRRENLGWDRRRIVTRLEGRSLLAIL